MKSFSTSFPNHLIAPLLYVSLCWGGCLLAADRVGPRESSTVSLGLCPSHALDIFALCHVYMRTLPSAGMFSQVLSIPSIPYSYSLASFHHRRLSIHYYIQSTTAAKLNQVELYLLTLFIYLMLLFSATVHIHLNRVYSTIYSLYWLYKWPTLFDVTFLAFVKLHCH